MSNTDDEKRLVFEALMSKDPSINLMWDDVDGSYKSSDTQSAWKGFQFFTEFLEGTEYEE